MKDIELFQQALGLTKPWIVKESTFSIEKKQLDIYIGFPKGSTFKCPQCGNENCKAYDTEEKDWRHLNFFQHNTYLHARTPRIECPACGVKTADVPWARPKSGFTLLFEAFVMALAKEMPVNAVARTVGEHDTLIWRILNHYVEEAREHEDCSSVTQIGIDETSRKKGHNYITLFVDMEQSKVIYVTEGKDANTLTAFKKDLEEHGGQAEQIKEVSCDMSPAFQKGVETELPQASLTFDKFHTIKLVNEAVDEVRRQEQKDRPELKKSRYTWLKNPDNLTDSEKNTLEHLDIANLHLKTARAYHIKINFQELYLQPKEQAEAYLKKWYFWATHSKLEPIIKVAKTIKRHWDGILRWFDSKLTNGVLEGINSLIQAAKAKARGYRSTKNLITIVYLLAGKLSYNLPT